MDLRVMDTDYFLLAAGALLILAGLAIMPPFFWPGLGTVVVGVILLSWGIYERVTLPAADEPVEGPEDER